MVAATRTVDELFDELAEAHFRVEPGLLHVLLCSDNGDSVVRLLEVNSDAFPSGSVEPFVFAPTAEVPLPVYIADVTPAEMERIRAGEIGLPDGWRLGRALSRPDER